MSSSRPPRLICLLLLCAAAHARAVDVPQQLRACGDAGEYPPFAFFERVNGKPNGRPAGFHTEFLPALLARSGRKVSIALLPWKRCVALAQEGKFDLILDAANTQLRRRQFWLTVPYAQLTSVVMYDPRRPIAAPADAAQLAALRRCEMLGWDSSRAGLPSQQEEQSFPASLEMGLSMLNAGRCEAMVVQLEVISSLSLVGGGQWAQGLAYHLVPNANRSPLQYGVSRAVAYGAALRDLLDEEIARMGKSGAAARMLERYRSK